MKRALAAIVAAVVVFVSVPAGAWAQAQPAPDEKAKREAERRQDIEYIRSVFSSMEPEGMEEREPVWLLEMKGGSQAPLFNYACRGVVKMWQIERAFDLAKKYQAEENPVPPDVVTHDKAMEIAQSVAEETGQKLVHILGLPRDVRRTRGCEIEGRDIFEDGFLLMHELASVLKIANIEPKDISKTPTELRDLLLADLRARVLEARAEIKAERAGASDAFYFVDEALEVWRFTTEELGLTSEEAAELKRLKTEAGR